MRAEPIASGKIPGEYLQAWLVAYEDFRRIKGLSNAEKRLEHYFIYFSQDGRYWFFSFTALLPEGKDPRLGQPEFGTDVSYWVEKETLHIVRRQFGE